ncbi:MAG: DUF922 domain-containing Zn-dependent protease [Chloroflexota bacterium]|nr:DUF922 domain-containing Zn-dependent protease [Chloroflexota bacterium]
MMLSILSLVVTLVVTTPTATTSALEPLILAPVSEPRTVEMVGRSIRHDPQPAAAVAAEPISRDETAAPLVAKPSANDVVALPMLTADVWNAAERYYAISGNSPAGIVASGQANIPMDPSGAERHAMAYAGPILWEHRPTYVIDAATGDCTMTGVSSTVAYEATVPRWTSPKSVSPGLLAWWKVVLEHIRVHEGHHIHILADFVNALPERLAGQPCGTWGRIVDQWSADIVSAQAAFDASEAGWVYPRYPSG